ncbi:hypothetical protein M408DRAFT_204852 [Serendipita vermifera MAFF 305830]|uniref:Uncharacterized protein n=1 Tax=Serendipita vermifera MAFF 305830 TaxID=933852 RepID=A0A0C3AML5_SERVB|nr:hypothetical protein M408DRAFT_204852 [Serendipita vermifera MAFF 305830]
MNIGHYVRQLQYRGVNNWDLTYRSDGSTSEAQRGLLWAQSYEVVIENMPSVLRKLVKEWSGNKTEEIIDKLLSLLGMEAMDIDAIPGYDVIQLRQALKVLVGPNGVVCSVETSGQEHGKRNGFTKLSCTMHYVNGPCSDTFEGNNLLQRSAAHIFTGHLKINPFACSCREDFGPSQGHQYKKHRKDINCP